jgi:uncharacterized protein YbaR (Trm112 family)
MKRAHDFCPVCKASIYISAEDGKFQDSIDCPECKTELLCFIETHYILTLEAPEEDN